MKKNLVVIVICVLSALICCVPNGCVRKSPDPYAGRPIKNISTLIDRLAKTIDWCPTNNIVVYGQFGADGYVDIYLLNPSTGGRSSLTDGKEGCPQKSNGNAAWHPSGKYIVFTAEKESNPVSLRREAVPGSGYNCDLWLASADGSNFYPLTNYPMYDRAVIHPHFSHDGVKLFWAERLGNSHGSDWGEWALKIAEFSVDQDSPRLSNVQSYQPGQNHYFYESHCFNADDDKVLFTANSGGQSDSGLDIYEMDLKTGRTVNLTNTPTDWDEHAQYSPDGEHIAWMSATGLGVSISGIADHAWENQLATELWLMDRDGTGKQGLTYFNDFGYAESLGSKRAIVSDITWSPDGEQIAVLVGLPDSPEKSCIFLVELR